MTKKNEQTETRTAWEMALCIVRDYAHGERKFSVDDHLTRGGNVLGMVMPNGKKLQDCTGAEGRSIS